MNIKALTVPLFGVLLSACYAGTGFQSETDDSADGLPSGEAGDAEDTGNDPDDADDADDDGDSGSPNPDGEGPAELPQGRQIRRLTADQFVRSLEKVTEQPWPDYELYAAAMGKADFAEITEHDRNLSVTFEKFANDAAIATCRAAVDSDAMGETDAILRFATLDVEEGGELAPLLETDIRANVQYLFLRFLGDEVALDSPLVDPWVELVLAPMITDDETTALDVQRERWAAVCVGFATHVDFITY